MAKFKGIIIQSVFSEYDLNHISTYTTDGKFEYEINAKHITEATSKMLNHFYEKYWFGSETDLPIEKFKKLSNENKVDMLWYLECSFDYIIHFDRNDVETIKNSI